MFENCQQIFPWKPWLLAGCWLAVMKQNHWHHIQLPMPWNLFYYNLITYGSQERAPIEKRMEVIIRNYWKKPKRHQNLLLLVWLKFIFTYKRHQNSWLTNTCCHIFQPSSPKGTMNITLMLVETQFHPLSPLKGTTITLIMCICLGTLTPPPSTPDPTFLGPQLMKLCFHLFSL